MGVACGGVRNQFRQDTYRLPTRVFQEVGVGQMTRMNPYGIDTINHLAAEVDSESKD